MPGVKGGQQSEKNDRVVTKVNGEPCKSAEPSGNKARPIMEPFVSIGN